MAGLGSIGLYYQYFMMYGFSAWNIWNVLRKNALTLLFKKNLNTRSVSRHVKALRKITLIYNKMSQRVSGTL